MKQSRRKIIVGVMVPIIIALIVLRRTMGAPNMNGVGMITIESLLLTGALLGIALSQAISVFRKPTREQTSGTNFSLSTTNAEPAAK